MRDRERTAAKTCQGIIGDFTQSMIESRRATRDSRARFGAADV